MFAIGAEKGDSMRPMKSASSAGLGLLALLAACTPPATETPGATPGAAPVAHEVGPGAYRGAMVAAQVCSQCHDIGNGTAPAQLVGAPDFLTIARRADTTASGLAEWMRTYHPKMPNYVFSGQEVTDLAEYIASLRNGAP